MFKPFAQGVCEAASDCIQRIGRVAANVVWMAACYPAYRRLRKALLRPRATQEAILAEIVTNNATSTFGKTHRFADIGSVADFQRMVPLGNYDALSPHIDGIRSGKDSASLTTAEVCIFEKTSGSSAAAKYIPYTEALRSEFQSAVRAWLFDLYRSDLRLLTGRSYWLITPLSRDKEVTPSGIPVGFESDADYLGTLERKIAEALFAVPSELAQVQDLECSLYLTLRFLLQASDLTLLYVWSPSFLCILMDRLDAWTPQLLDDLENGTATLSSPDKCTALPKSITKRILPQTLRAQRLRDILRTSGNLATAEIWPGLRLISCWTEAAARQSLGAIQTRFPGIRIQGKGLLATEGVATIPWTPAGGCIPALTSHFYEFLPLDGGTARLVHELVRGESYSLAITTGGGLYRYQLGDQVRVRSFCPGTGVPVLEFVGRDDGVSDLRGEKLSPAFVQTTLDAILTAEGLLSVTIFAMLAPCQPESSDVPFYVLYLELAAPLEHKHATSGLHMLHNLAYSLDNALRANPHYHYCRELGQLLALRVFNVKCKAPETYVQRCIKLGQRAGNIKPTSLHCATGWDTVFDGEFAHTYRHAEIYLNREGALC